MSFIDGSVKPKLVEQKIFDKVMKLQQENKPFKISITDIWPSIYKLLRTHILSISIIIIIVLLLVYRYYDVKNKKNRTLTKSNIKEEYEDEYEDEYQDESE